MRGWKQSVKIGQTGKRKLRDRGLGFLLQKRSAPSQTALRECLSVTFFRKVCFQNRDCFLSPLGEEDEPRETRGSAPVHTPSRWFLEPPRTQGGGKRLPKTLPQIPDLPAQQLHLSFLPWKERGRGRQQSHRAGSLNVTMTCN